MVDVGVFVSDYILNMIKNMSIMLGILAQPIPTDKYEDIYKYKVIRLDKHRHPRSHSYLSTI